MTQRNHHDAGITNHCASVVLVADLRSQSLTVNREKVTNSRQQSNIGNFVWSHGVRVLYTPPHTPVGLHLESRWIPGVQMESTWNTTKSVYFWIIQLESMWSLHGVHVESAWSPCGVCIESIWSLCRLQMDSTQIQLNLNQEVFKIEISRLK